MQAFFYPFTIHSLEFDTVPIDAYSSAGTKYTRLVRVGMPKLPPEALNLAFYLYKTVSDAKQGKKFGGTGFCVGILSETDQTHIYFYGVTNWHVAVSEGASIIRINMADGNTDIIKYDPTEWEFIPGGGDIAISPILELKNEHLQSYVNVDMFATSKIISEKGINVGDGVFMIGRFIDHNGKTTNLPAVRFGNISVMPTYIPAELNNQKQGESFCIDMHSRTGYSGSPVMVYRTIGGDLTHVTPFPQPFTYLLGVHWGQFREEWKLKNGKKNKKLLVLSGMTCVTPVERILDLINIPKLKAERARRDAEREKEH